MASDDEIIDLDEAFNDISDIDSDLPLSSDDEKLNNTKFTENELRILCGIDCFVDLRRKNLFYSYEKGVRQYFAHKNYEFQPKVHYELVERKLKRRFHKLYTNHCLSWERESEKRNLKRIRENKRNAIKFLQMTKDFDTCLSLNLDETMYTTDNDNDNNDITSDSQISSQTVICKVQPMQQITQVQSHDESEDIIFKKKNEQKDCDQEENRVVSTFEENTDALDNFMHQIASKNTAVISPYRHVEDCNTQELTYSEFNGGIQHFTVIHSQPITSTQQPDNAI